MTSFSAKTIEFEGRGSTQARQQERVQDCIIDNNTSVIHLKECILRNKKNIWERVATQSDNLF